MVELAYQVTFDAAHRLRYHHGKCQHLHGHTWKVEVKIEGEADPVTGMLLDFADLRDVIDVSILDLFDHALILNSKDAELYRAIAQTLNSPDRIVTIEGEPTCENLSRIIWERIVEYLKDEGYTDDEPGSVRLKCVTVWESSHSYATYKGEKNEEVSYTKPARKRARRS
jgi:6-pyruvoyltetrahydropterin/6-carboxytetrahydropterin synthase